MSINDLAKLAVALFELHAKRCVGMRRIEWEDLRPETQVKWFNVANTLKSAIQATKEELPK